MLVTQKFCGLCHCRLNVADSGLTAFPTKKMRGEEQKILHSLIFSKGILGKIAKWPKWKRHNNAPVGPRNLYRGAWSLRVGLGEKTNFAPTAKVSQVLLTNFYKKKTFPPTFVIEKWLNSAVKKKTKSETTKTKS